MERTEPIRILDLILLSIEYGGDPAKQSLYSRQVRELEQFFGVELTRRKGKGIEVTEQGREFARQVRAHLQSLTDFKKG
jgi:hypothetical protein